MRYLISLRAWPRFQPFLGTVYIPYVDLDDFEAKLLGRNVPRKRDRSGLKKLLNDSFFCRKIDFQRLALGRGRTYIRWRDGTCGKVPGIPDVEPAVYNVRTHRTTFQDKQPTMTDPGEFDGLDFDNGKTRGATNLTKQGDREAPVLRPPSLNPNTPAARCGPERKFPSLT